MNGHSNVALFQLFQQTEAALQQQDLSTALLLVKKIFRRRKKCQEGLLLRARIYGATGEFDEARRCLEQAVASAPARNGAQAAFRSGLASQGFYDRSIAEKFFRRAVELGGVPEALITLAEHLSKTRQEDEAKVIVDELLEKSPNHPRAVLLWSQLHRDDSQYETKLAQLTASAVPRIRLLAHYELGRYFDFHGEFDLAYKHFCSAKAPLQKSAKNLIERRQFIRSRLVESAKLCDADLLGRWAGTDYSSSGAGGGITLLAGHPRSGTTLVEQILDSHAGIVSVEESDNFSFHAFVPAMKSLMKRQWIHDSLNSLEPSAILRARTQYFEAMSRYIGAPLKGRMLIDKNPSLTAMIPAMLRFFPELKLVMMLRDPRDVVLSCYMQSFHPLNEITASYLTLEDAALDYAAVMGVYGEMRQHLGDREYAFRYEDLVGSPEESARDLFLFLGVEWDPQVMSFHERSKTKIVRSPTADAVTESIHKRATNRWCNYERYFGKASEILQPSLESFGYH